MPDDRQQRAGQLHVLRQYLAHDEASFTALTLMLDIVILIVAIVNVPRHMRPPLFERLFNYSHKDAPEEFSGA